MSNFLWVGNFSKHIAAIELADDGHWTNLGKPMPIIGWSKFYSVRLNQELFGVFFGPLALFILRVAD